MLPPSLPIIFRRGEAGGERASGHRLTTQLKAHHEVPELPAAQTQPAKDAERADRTQVCSTENWFSKAPKIHKKTGEVGGDS